MKMTVPVKFDCDDSIRPHLQKVFDGEYEVPLFSRKTHTIIDAGANVGAFSVWAAHRWPGSTIYAYEPHPLSFDLLRRNTAGLGVFCYNYGLGKPGRVVLHNGANNSGENTIFGSSGDSEVSGTFVDIHSPLDCAADATILKIDTEGCEVEILEPLIEAGRTFDAIMVEFHRINDRRKIDSLLKEYIYIGGETLSPTLGTLKYIHPKFIDFETGLLR